MIYGRNNCLQWQKILQESYLLAFTSFSTHLGGVATTTYGATSVDLAMDSRGEGLETCHVT